MNDDQQSIPDWHADFLETLQRAPWTVRALGEQIADVLDFADRKLLAELIGTGIEAGARGSAGAYLGQTWKRGMEIYASPDELWCHFDPKALRLAIEEAVEANWEVANCKDEPANRKYDIGEVLAVVDLPFLPVLLLALRDPLIGADTQREETEANAPWLTTLRPGKRAPLDHAFEVAAERIGFHLSVSDKRTSAPTEDEGEELPSILSDPPGELVRAYLIARLPEGNGATRMRDWRGVLPFYLVAKALHEDAVLRRMVECDETGSVRARGVRST